MKLSILIAVVATCVLAADLQMPETEWARRVRTGRTLVEQERYLDAVAELKAALRLKENVKHGRRADDATYYLLGLAYREAGLMSQAIHCFRRAMQIAEQHGRSDTYVRAVIHLAVAYLTAGEPKKADQLGIGRLLERQRSLGTAAPTLAALTQVQGAIVAASGRFSEAEPLLKRSVELWMAAVGPDHPDTAAALQNSGIVYARQNRFDEAESLLHQALATWRRLEPHPTSELKSLTSLAEIHLARRQYPAAAALYEQAVSIIDSRLGSKHPDLPRALLAFGYILRHLDRRSEANQILARAKRLLSESPRNSFETHTVSINGLRSR